VKVLQITGIYPVPPEGGLEVAVLNLARGLFALGVDVHVVGAADRPQASRECGLVIEGLRGARLASWIRVPYPRGISELRREIGWADIVHVHNPQELFTLIGAGMALFARKPLYLSLLSPGTLSRHPNPSYRILGRLDDHLVRELVERAAFVQVKNLLDLNLALSINRNTRLVPDGVPDAFLDAPPSDNSFRREHNLEGRYPVLLFAGRLHPLKGPDHVIRILPNLAKQFAGVTAVLAGPDPLGMAADLGNLARNLGVTDRVRIVGQLSERNKLEAIDSADLVVVPSLADFVEGFSIIASESWARGKPVVGYPSGALRVRIEDGRNGTLARSVTPSDLEEAVTRALSLGPVSPAADIVSWSEVARQMLHEYSAVKSRAVGSRSPNPGPPGENHF
jgi:glycosyltransferase involved in cell wall biosynthesis